MTEPQYDVAIVGAGFSGLYLLHRCRQFGLRARVWEAGDGVGGTWYWNRYPGARCDIESLQYSYQFDESLQQEWEWSERYSAQPEILRYAEHVAERFNLLDGIDFNRRVTRAVFDEANALWSLSSDSGEHLTARFCVMATGCLSVPNWPPIAGYDDFSGDIYHTALWPHDTVDFANKRVAVIGTGSSGIQTIPHIAAAASHLTVFQRTPNYSVPAHNRALDPAYSDSVKADYRAMRARAKQRIGGIDGVYNSGSALDDSYEERIAQYERRWQQGGLLFIQSYGDLLTNKAANDTLVEFVHSKIRSIVSDTAVAELLCPPNIIGGKRLCVDTNYYETFNRDNVSLVDIRNQPINSINNSGLSVGDKQFDVDIIVVAAGFDAMTGALLRMDIQGRAGAALCERWKNGPRSYLGLAMHDFPNLFTVTGPGSPSVLTNMLPTLEQHVEWITDCIVYLKQKNSRMIEASLDAENNWWHHVQEVANQGIKQTANSWYLGANIEGKPRVFMPYLGGLPRYLEKCEAVVAKGYEGFIVS
jgi:cyclohexanone monooxygenase